MKLVPKAERTRWHEKAIEASKGADRRSRMELPLETGELEKTNPGIAARLWRARGMRIVKVKKNKYYEAALSDFARARRSFDRTGLAFEGEKTVSQVRTDHQRKKGFLSGFERLVGGSGSSAPTVRPRRTRGSTG